MDRNDADIETWIHLTPTVRDSPLSAFGHATVVFTIHVVGQNQANPIDSIVKDISWFFKPNCKRQ